MIPIGFLKTDFTQKFGVPRQAGLVTEARGILKLNDEVFLKQALKGLEGFSHIWVIFLFHEFGARAWKPSIRPPRLGGAKKVGVLASRSPHRPNPIGLSALRLEKIDLDAPGGAELHVSGVDILDGTPVLDIKPYLPYADAIPDAQAGWAKEEIIRIPIDISEQAEASIALFSTQAGKPLRGLILQILELDPRPAFQKRKSQGVRYGFKILDYDVRWHIEKDRFVIDEVIKDVAGDVDFLSQR